MSNDGAADHAYRPGHRDEYSSQSVNTLPTSCRGSSTVKSVSKSAKSISEEEKWGLQIDEDSSSERIPWRGIAPSIYSKTVYTNRLVQVKRISFASVVSLSRIT